MQHLTVDQMIEFASISGMDQRSVELASTVTTHIRQCSQCFERVKAFQLISDALMDPQLMVNTEQDADTELFVAYEYEDAAHADR